MRCDDKKALSSSVGCILVLTGFFYLNFISRIISSPLMPDIRASLGMNHGAAGGVFLFIASGYLAGIILSGIISCKIEHRSVVFISAISCGTAVICMSFSNNIAVLNGFACLTGLAAGLYLPSGIASITHIVKPSGWGRALSIHELAPNLAFITAPLIAEVCLSFMSWRNTFQLIGCCSVAAGFIYYSYSKIGDFKGQMPAYSQAVSFLRMRSYWIMLILFSLGVLSTLGIYTMIPLYLIGEFNYSRSAANTVLSFSRVLTLITIFASGWSVDKFGLKRTLSSVFLVTSVLTFSMAAASGRFLIPAVFAQPLAAVCFFPAGFAALSAIFPENSRNVGISLSVPLAFWVGAGLAPAALGAFADRGMFRAGFAAAGAAFFVGGVLSYFLDLPSVKEDADADAEK